jgi:anti-sigma factor (TIGR02949 family)
MVGKDCDDLLHELGHLLHGELPPDRAKALKDHLDDCPPCFESADFQAQLKAMVAKRCTEEVPADFKARIVGLLNDQVEPS